MICELDCLGMDCKEALMMVQDTAMKLKVDDKLVVIFDCPCSAKTIPSWARKQGFYVEMENCSSEKYRCSIERI